MLLKDNKIHLMYYVLRRLASYYGRGLPVPKVFFIPEIYPRWGNNYWRCHPTRRAQRGHGMHQDGYVTTKRGEPQIYQGGACFWRLATRRCNCDDPSSKMRVRYGPSAGRVRLRLGVRGKELPFGCSLRSLARASPD